MDTEDNSVNMGNMGIHGGTRRGIMKGRARKPRSMSPLRRKPKSRKHGGAEEEEMEGGARRGIMKRRARKPRSMSPLRTKSKSRKHGGAEEEEEMDGGARRGIMKGRVRKPRSMSPLRRKPKSRKHGGAEEEEMDGGARRGKKKTSRYIMFVKRRMCDMKKTDPGLPQVEKMRKIAAEWKANK
jgi:hypothetical protein